MSSSTGSATTNTPNRSLQFNRPMDSVGRDIKENGNGKNSNGENEDSKSTSKKKNMNELLGIDYDDDFDDNNKNSIDSTNVSWNDYEKLKLKCDDLNNELKSCQNKNNSLELKYIELQTVSRSTLAIANRGFEEKLNNLKKQLADKDLQLEDNEALIESLKEQSSQNSKKTSISPTHNLKYVEKLIEKIKTLEETITVLNNTKGSDSNIKTSSPEFEELLQSKELEFNEYKDLMAEKLVKAKKKMTDLIETAKKREASLKEKVVTKIKEIQDQCEIEKEELLKNAQNNLSDTTEITKLNEEIVLLKAQILALAKNEELINDKEESIKNLNLSLNEKDSMIDKLIIEADTLNKNITSLESKFNNLKMQSNSRDNNYSKVISKLKSKLLSELSVLKSDCKNIKLASDFSAPFTKFNNEISSSIQSFLLNQNDSYQKLLNVYQKECSFRKELFNQLQELKGNIRVFCRIRPLSSMELQNNENNVVTYNSENSITLYNVEKDVNTDFEFDHIFDPSYTQEQVFQEVSPLVQSAVDGFNASIFAYGQTGSGKTYTMEGPPNDRGVNFRALQLLFNMAELAVSKQTEFDISISILEIYNEQIIDLLNSSQNVDLRIVQDKQACTQIQGLSVFKVLSLMSSGYKNRAVGQTDMNEHSSRSHLVLTVYIVATNKVTNVSTIGKLHLIDLAGSERLSRSGATGNRLKEAQNINYSLSALGDVINARINNNAHIPFRNSILTQVLQDSLSNNSKTLMIVQGSPSDSNIGETLCSLRFAARTRTVELGKARKNSVTNTPLTSPVIKPLNSATPRAMR